MDKLERFHSLSDYIVFGAGEASLPVCRYLRSVGKRIIAHADNNLSLVGSSRSGIPIISPDEIPGLMNTHTGVVIASSYQAEIARQLTSQLEISLDRVFPYMTEMFYPQYGEAAFKETSVHLESLLARMADDESREYICSLTKFRRSLNPLDLSPNPKLIGFYNYSTPRPMLRDGDCVVDCGAYTGDTAAEFLRRARLRKVIAVEALPANYHALQEWILASGHNSVMAVNAYLSADGGYINVCGNPSETLPDRRHSSGSGAAFEQVKTIRLDDLVAAEKVDLIKIDVEGEDLSVLLGAGHLISTQRPALMVSAYHRRDHIWQVPDVVARSSPGYSIYAGHHPRCLHEVEYYALPD